MTSRKRPGRRPSPRRPARPVPKPARKKPAAAKKAARRRAPARPARPKRGSAPTTPAEVREAVLALIRSQPGITDDSVARKLKLTKARTSAVARSLEKAGLVQRHRGEGGASNHAVPSPEDLARRERARERRREETQATALSDVDVREAVTDWLAARGFDVEREPGPDLLAHRDGVTLACEAVGGGKHLSLPRNAVPQSLGRLVERLGRGHAMYSLAFPDLPAFRTSFVKLAPGVRRGLNLHAFFVRRAGGTWQVTALDPRGRPTNLL